TPNPIGIHDIVMNGSSRQQNVKMSVFVDVGKLSNDSEDVMRSWPTAVGLYPLNECIRRFGNTRKFLLEEFVGDGESVRNSGIPMLRNLQTERKLAIPFPVLGKGDVRRIGLDKLKHEMIESRFELINDFTDNHLNVTGCPDEEVKLLLAVRVLDDLISVSVLDQ